MPLSSAAGAVLACLIVGVSDADTLTARCDPTTDAANLSRIWGVVLKGHYQSRAVLDKMLLGTAAAYASENTSQINAKFTEDPNHVH